MKIIADTKYWKINYDEKYNIHRIFWKEGAENIPAETFKTYLCDFVNWIEEYKVQGFLTDARQAHIVMTIDIQEWHDKEIVPRYIENNLKKIAFLLPKEIFAAVSINQAFEEEQSQKLVVQFFEEEHEAEQWITS